MRSRSSRTGAERVDDLDLVDGVQVTATLPAEQRHVAEWLEPGTELGRRAPHALGDGPDLAVLLGHQGDDPIRLSEADGA